MMKKWIIRIILFLILVWGGYSLWQRQGRSLDSGLIPTAEALIQNPLPRPAFVGINPPVGKNLTQGQQMCLSLEGRELLKKGEKFTDFRTSISFNTFLYINNRPVSPVERSYPLGGFNMMDPGPENGTAYLCYVPDLEKGVHIAEVTTKDSSGKELTYKWAFYVQ